MAKKRGSSGSARTYDIISIVFVTLSVLWVLYVIIRLIGG
jgi:hypothetical protein